MTDPSTLEPLRARPGARFECHGDGLCCTDVHAFGPLSDDEAEALSAIDARAVVLHGRSRVLPPKPDGSCIFRSEGRCALHALLGARSKPQSCRQFPFHLVATPVGGRVVTEHRCPCRTLGERAPLTAEVALEAVGPDATPDRAIRSTLVWDESRDVDLREWERLEAPLLARLAAGEDPIAVLGVEPLTPAASWAALGRAYRAEEDDTGFAAAVRRFGASLARLLGEAVPHDEHLPWGDAFDRAQARSPLAGDPEAILRDWVADYVWSLEWAFTASFARTRGELASRVAVARAIAAELAAEGARPDRAMAEAVAVVELAALTDDYPALVAGLPEPMAAGDERA